VIRKILVHLRLPAEAQPMAGPRVGASGSARDVQRVRMLRQDRNQVATGAGLDTTGSFSHNCGYG